MDEIFADIRNYLTNHYELVPLLTAFGFIAWLYGVLKEHDWVYHNRLAIQSGINELPLNAQKWIWFIFGLFWLVVSLFAAVGLYLHKI